MAGENELVETGKIDLKNFNIILASPTFAQALAEATKQVNGWKIRLEYKRDLSTRAVSQSITVSIAGKIIDRSGNNAPPIFQNAEFTATRSHGSEFIIIRDSKISVITEKEFVEFEE